MPVCNVLQTSPLGAVAHSRVKPADMLRPMNMTPCAFWLRLEILFIIVMNRIGDKGQPWWKTSLPYCQKDEPNDP